MDHLTTQHDILARIRSGDNQAIKTLYKSAFTYCTSYIIKHNGNQEDAKEIFQRSMVVLLEKLRDENFTIKSNPKTYLYGICKNQWLKELRRTNKLHFISEQEGKAAALVYEEASYEEKEEQESRLQSIFSALKKGSEDCKKLLQLTYFEKKTDKEIAPVMNYSLEFVRNKRRRCIASIRKRINKEHGKTQ